ncbi:MAG TPA: hypothetical protein VK428_12540 [Acidimicrobiales bacterium]|nr:hypothetical protein [Acidimicrobiales bacterium]
MPSAYQLSPSHVSPTSFCFEVPVSSTEYLTWFRDHYGPTMNAFDAPRQSDRADELFDELDDLFGAQNTSSDPAKTAIPATFLRVTVAVETALKVLMQGTRPGGQLARK